MTAKKDDAQDIFKTTAWDDGRDLIKPISEPIPDWFLCDHDFPQKEIFVGEAPDWVQCPKCGIYLDPLSGELYNAEGKLVGRKIR